MTILGAAGGHRAAGPDMPHEHAWLTESSHHTSEGRVLYVRCGLCGSRRVDLQAHPQSPPAPLSATVGSRPVETVARRPLRRD